jgi:hypothetical protein
MNHHQKHPQPRCKAPAYLLAFERLDEALDENMQSDYSEKTELLGMAMFGDLWRPREQTGNVVLQK